jgi:predicted nucleic acid-binding protein
MVVVVPDASVILKWALPSDGEPEFGKALVLRNAIRDELVRALVPSLWLFEVGNTIARRFPQHAEDWLAALVKMGLEEAPMSSQLLGQVLELTERYEVSFYDAAYHATAVVYRGTFVTADDRYFGRVKAHGAITTIGNWKPPTRRTP